MAKAYDTIPTKIDLREPSEVLTVFMIYLKRVDHPARTVKTTHKSHGVTGINSCGAFSFQSPASDLVIGVNVNRIRIGIVGRDAFWCNAVVVEWEHQYPDRKLFAEAGDCYLIEADWLDDLELVAQECFSRIVVAPADPSRRSWLRRFVPIRNDNKV